MKKKGLQLKEIDNPFSRALFTPVKHQTSKECSGLTRKNSKKHGSGRKQIDTDFYRDILHRITNSENSQLNHVTVHHDHVKRERDKKVMRTKTTSKGSKPKTSFKELMIRSQKTLKIINIPNKEDMKEEIINIDKPTVSTSHSGSNLPIKTEDMKEKISKMKEVLVSPLEVKGKFFKRRSYFITNLNQFANKADSHVLFSEANNSHNKEYPPLITNTDAKMYSNKAVFKALTKRKNSMHIPSLKMPHPNNSGLHSRYNEESNNTEVKNNLMNIDEKDNENNENVVEKPQENKLILKKEDNFSKQVNNSKANEQQKDFDINIHKKIDSSKEEEEENVSKHSCILKEKKKKTWLCCIPVS